MTTSTATTALRGLFLGMTVAVAAAGTALAGTGAPKAPEVKIGKVAVAPNLHMMLGVGGFTGGNVAALTGPDGLLIVDDKVADFGEALEKALDALGKGKPRFVLNTHWHFDHVGGNERFGAAVIVAHDNVRRLMSAPQEFKSLQKKIPAAAPAALPDVTYNDRLTIHFNGEEIQVHHFQGGHTDGDSVVYFKGAKVLHLGDLFFNGTFPFADVDHGGNAFRLTRNIGVILERFPADAKVIPGHGPLATMADLRAYHAMLQATTKIVKDAADKGMDLAAITAQGFPPEWKKWEWAFIDSTKWIHIIHASLGK